ncbi:MAG: dihydrofolate reductase [Bacteroidales bacterium]|nr:dihydrofolate reductase [Bacteroidales bacterium]
MNKFSTLLIMATTLTVASCTSGGNKKEKTEEQAFKFQTEQFADAKILRYQVPGFDSLTLKQKKLIFYLSQAALCGRDITFDQNYKYNLLIRKTLEAIYNDYSGNRDNEEFKNFVIYLKEVWFCNGIHHHYSTDKLVPGFPEAYFKTLVDGTKKEDLPLKSGQSTEQFIQEVTPLIFDPSVAPKRISLDASGDLILNSAANFYDGVNQKDVEQYYTTVKKEDSRLKKDLRVSYGLNSKLIRENGKIAELTWKVGGLYSPAIEQIVSWLEKALTVAESPDQKVSIEKLIDYYKTGDLVTWDEYNIAWVKDDSRVDFVNGFIEVYGDPMAMKATWESVVNFKDIAATRRTEVLSKNAQYFEDHSPVAPEFRKKQVKGVTAKVITVAQLGGDCYPTTPIGINLPNANWIRKDFGSKSVTMDNITYAYDQSSLGSGFLEEFAYSQEEIDRAKKCSYLAGNLMTDLHECLGHGSGQLKPGVSAESLKNYHSAIEEARADLFALYYLSDPVMIKYGLISDPDVAKSEYDGYIRNGLLTQLVRIKPGKDIEQAHMRDRSLIAHWIYEKGAPEKIIEKVTKNGKTYFRINDYEKLRTKFGELLRLIQQITSEGDYQAAKNLVENYAVKVDPVLHKEVLERYEKLKIAPYAGFLNPDFTTVIKGDTISDITVSYPDDYTRQMLFYSKNYSFLPAR